MLTPLLIEDSFERFYGYHIAAIIFCLLMCLLIGYYFHKWHFYYIPESAGHMLVGFIGGLFVTMTNLISEEALVFSPEMFFFVLLPIIIMEAGYSMKTGPFFRNIGVISLLAICGTLTAAVITALGVYVAIDKFDVWQTLDASPSKNFLECLLFGTLLSAVDPIATLAILGSKDVNAPPTLYAIVFGESVLNDAVTIVLFNTLYPFVEGDEDFGSLALLEATGLFIGITLGSVTLGFVLGLTCSWIFKHADFDELPETEFLVIFLFAFGSYGLAEYLELSGIMAVFVCGITMGRYAFKSATMTTKWSTTFGFKAMAVAAETFVFIYLGLQFALAVQMRPEGTIWSIPFTLFVMFWCLLARGVHVPLFINLANTKRKRKIHAEMQFVMWFGGLRGAIAFALALNFPEPNRNIVITVTLCVVLVTTFICGGLTEPILSKFDIKEDDVPLMVAGDKEEDDERDVVERRDTRDILLEKLGDAHDSTATETIREDSMDEIRVREEDQLSGFARWCFKFDSGFLHKHFTKYGDGPKNVHDWDGNEQHVRTDPARGLAHVRKTTQEFQFAFAGSVTSWASRHQGDERSRFVSEGHYYTWR